VTRKFRKTDKRVTAIYRRPDENIHSTRRVVNPTADEHNHISFVCRVRADMGLTSRRVTVCRSMRIDNTTYRRVPTIRKVVGAQQPLYPTSDARIRCIAYVRRSDSIRVVRNSFRTYRIRKS